MSKNSPQKVVLTKDILSDNHHWLDRDYKKGEELFVYNGATHKCISVNGIACTERIGEEPFFEIPKAALKYIES